jgi:uncharacterized protein YbbC (DUF1343 family)
MAKTPAAGSAKFAGQECQGLLVEVVDRAALEPMAMGVAMVAAALAVASDRARITPSNFDLLAGTDALRKALEAGAPAADIVSGWQTARDGFVAQRERYLLYT